MRAVSGALRPLIVFVAALALALSGCADGDETTEPDPEPVPDPQTQTVEVFFTNLELGEIGEVFPVERETASDDLPLAALDELLAGPTAEERAEGYSSWFSDDTADLLLSLQIDDGVAHVDFDPQLPDVIPNASTSAGSTSLLAELDTTLEQFPEITSTRYSLGGDVAAFYEWLQLAPPDGIPDREQGDAPDATEDPDPATDPGADVPAATAVVEVFFTNTELGPDDEVFPVERRVDTPAVLQGALDELLEGPTEQEQAEGYSSWFSTETEGLLDTVRIDDGIAQIDFDARLRQTIPGASSSAGSAALLAALDATATQFPTVEEAIYSLDGDVDAFYEWLQRAPPT